jgi:hypothetical protein
VFAGKVVFGATEASHRDRTSASCRLRNGFAERTPQMVQQIAWKAQVRLCGRYRKLMTKGKPKDVVVTAIAREMAAFLWAIGQQVAPTTAA